MPDARLVQLAGDLRREIEALDRVTGEAARCVSDLATRSPTYLELRGAGDIVHDFYNAVERYFERVASELDGGLPVGPDSHATLLARMPLLRGLGEVALAIRGELVAFVHVLERLAAAPQGR